MTPKNSSHFLSAQNKISLAAQPSITVKNWLQIQLKRPTNTIYTSSQSSSLKNHYLSHDYLNETSWLYIYVSWSTSELRVRLAPLNRFKPSSKIFYWPFQGGTSFVDLLCFCSVLCLLCFVRVCLYVLRGHLLGKGWPLGSRLWCLLWVCHFPIGILGQVWYLIVSIPDLCNLTYFYDAAILTRCYTQHALRPYIDSEINHIRHFIKIQFVNKGIEFINLPSIFKDKSVISSIPTYFENKESPTFVISIINLFVVLFLTITN